jgi:hypothetical protein
MLISLKIVPLLIVEGWFFIWNVHEIDSIIIETI